MKKLRITLIIILILISSVFLLKWWFVYQNKYVCKPRVGNAIENFINNLQKGEYETIEDNSMFIDKKHFKDIKGKVSNIYSWEVKDWGGDGAAYTIVRFNNSNEYALMIVPDKNAFFSCWGKEYRILTIRE